MGSVFTVCYWVWKKTLIFEFVAISIDLKSYEESDVYGTSETQ